MHLSRRLVLTVGCLALLTVIGGCGKRKGHLHGSIKYKDKPLVVATVTVFDEDQRPFQATVKDGTYSVEGIPEGPITVIVVSGNPAKSGKGPPNAKKRPGAKPLPGETKDDPGEEKQVEPPPGWFAIPKKYADVTTTPLKFPLKPGDNDYPINLVD